MPTSIDKYLDPNGLDETVLNIRQIAEGLEADMQDLPYARPDGIYPDMTVGAVIGADETAQWAQRETEGSGSATVRSVQGAAVVWEQIVKPNYPRTVTSKGVTYTSTSDGKITLDGTATGAESFTSSLVFSVFNGHKYLYKGADTSRAVFASVVGIGSGINSESIYTATADVASATLSVVIAATYTGTYECYPQLFDLTQMFGSGNEPTTVAEFERMFPASYYPYSTPTLKPVQIAGISSTTAQGGELDAIEWTAQTLRAADSVRDELTADELVTRVGAADASNAWVASVTTVNEHGIGYVSLAVDVTGPSFIDGISSNLPISTGSFANSTQREFACNAASHTLFYRFPTTEPVTLANAMADMRANNAECFYPLATPTTTPISPALPMSYKVEQGGTESIIVPDGEISAAPIITVAEPVNAGDEFARIWEAIQSLGYTRNVTQLSRPVSLTNIGSIDEVQKDATDVVEIDTTKEVQ